VKIENSDLSSTTSACLKTFVDLVNSNLEVAVDIESEPAAVKGELISTIVIAVATGIASNTIYDLLKCAVQQHASHLTGNEFIIINNLKISFRELLTNQELRNVFDEETDS